MQRELPLVSIIITSYNREELILKAIESALNQDYSNLEVIISDNCSTDGSDAIIRKYCNDPRLKYFRNEENIGMFRNFKKATYDLSKGEFLTYISSDDYLVYNSFISDAISVAQENKNIGIVFGRMSYMNTINGVFWEMPESPYFLKETWAGEDVFFESIKTGLLSFGACLLRRTAMIKVNAFGSELNNADIDASYKIMLEANVGFVNKLCYWQLGHDDNNGFPVDAKKIMQNLNCYEGVETYAFTKMPGKHKEVRKWKEHFILSAISWAFHTLKEKDKEQYRIFKKEAQIKYPDLYKKFIGSWKYKKLLVMHPVKKVFSPKLMKAISKIKKRIRF